MTLQETYPPGTVIGRLTVLAHHYGPRGTKGHNRLYFLCRCACGKEKTIVGYSLAAGKVKSCGCLLSERTRDRNRKRALPYGEAVFNAFCNTRYQTSRKGGRSVRGIEYHLTKQQVREITSSNCHYCGVAPYKVYTHHNCVGEWVHNGIDRIDSSGHYTEDNVVPCCEICNKAKGVYSEEDFYTWLDRIARFQGYTRNATEEIVDGNVRKAREANKSRVDVSEV